MNIDIGLVYSYHSLGTIKMNKREKAILTRLYWLIAEYKNEHHVLYYSKDVLQSVLRKEYTIAENLVNNKIVGESIIVPPILSENEGVRSDLNTFAESEHLSLPRKNIPIADFGELDGHPRSMRKRK